MSESPSGSQDCCSISSTPTEPSTATGDFDAAWRELFQKHDVTDVAGELIRLTEGGAHPVEITRLATATNRPEAEVRRLVERADAGLPSLHAGHTDSEAWLDFTTRGPARFWYEIGDRRIPVAGCGPDIFWTAQNLDVPMRVVTTCAVTGSTVTVELTPDGVTSVSPADAVVTAVHIGNLAEAATLTDRNRVDADVCTQQTFFANPEAAQHWLETHPGGRTFGVAEFETWFRNISTVAPAQAR